MPGADGYVTCERGHQHWGLAGAAGLFVRCVAAEEPTRYLLQHRSPEVHLGDTWSIPGGALDWDEPPVVGALREAVEELPSLPDDLRPVVAHVTDHGGWRYTTVVADVPRTFDVTGETGWETGRHGFRWLTRAEVDGAPLHPGFAASWPELRVD